MKKLILINFLLIFVIQKGISQNTFNSSGGNTSSSNGSISYSIGQVFYQTTNSTNGTINEGVQHAFEIFTLSGVEFQNINAYIKAFPNPVEQNLFVSIIPFEFENANYEMYDIQGKTISTGKIVSSETKVTVENLSSGSYILKILLNDNQNKTFKIIKN